jgi:hypothetical protein
MAGVTITLSEPLTRACEARLRGHRQSVSEFVNQIIEAHIYGVVPATSGTRGSSFRDRERARQERRPTSHTLDIQVV